MRQADRSSKITRAIQHLAELEALLNDYVASKPAEIYTEVQKISETETRIISRSKIKPIPAKSSLILGDIFHNLRAALDLMATKLARVTSQNDKNVYFPFAEDAVRLDQQIKDKNFFKCGADAVDLLRQFAPYKGGNVLLRAIHDFDIQDKHKNFISAGAWVGSSNIDFEFPEDGPLANMPLIQTLHDLVDLTDNVIEAFAALLAARESTTA